VRCFGRLVRHPNYGAPMFHSALIIFAKADGTTSGILIVTTGLTALGVILGAAIKPLGDFLTRKDQLKGYKRNIYRNFLDHGYWFLHGNLSPEDRQKRAESYLADWHRIRLIAEDGEVLRLTNDIREPEKFTDQRADDLLNAFSHELGSGGIR
jgi:hypothetical protein